MTWFLYRLFSCSWYDTKISPFLNWDFFADDDEDDDEEDDDDDDEGNSHFEDDIVEESALRFPTVADPDSDDIEYLFYPEHNEVILEHLEDRGRRSLHLPMWYVNLQEFFLFPPKYSQLIH